jgi:hypothetical protein
MIKIMIAKYKGIDARTGQPIRPGDEIAFDTDTRKAWITDDDDGLTFTTPDEYCLGDERYYANE